MSTITIDPTAVMPDADERERYARLAHLLSEETVRLVGSDREAMTIPADVAAVMRVIVQLLAANRAVMIHDIERDLTTTQAADLLNLSRPSLIKLLEEGAIPYAMVGTHRRIRFDDLMAYRAAWKAEQKRLLDELTRLGEEMGGYDLPPRPLPPLPE